MQEEDQDKSGGFLYFAYGSNLLTERIRILNSTAVKKDVAKLKGYELGFEGYGKRWHGAPATIRRRDDGHVWGIVWSLEHSDLANLDRQESGYRPIEVCVESAEGRRYQCRSYQILEQTTRNDDGDGGREEAENVRTEKWQPSGIYMKVIVKGAVENGLPDPYVESLRRVEHNGYYGPVDLLDPTFWTPP